VLPTLGEFLNSSILAYCPIIGAKPPDHTLTLARQNLRALRTGPWSCQKSEWMVDALGYPAQAAQIQKVSAQLEASKPAPQVAENNQ